MDVKRRELRLKRSKSKFPTITKDGSPKIKVFESSFEPNKWSRVCYEYFTDGENFYTLFFGLKLKKIASSNSTERKFDGYLIS